MNLKMIWILYIIFFFLIVLINIDACMTQNEIMDRLGMPVKWYEVGR